VPAATERARPRSTAFELSAALVDRHMLSKISSRPYEKLNSVPDSLFPEPGEHVRLSTSWESGRGIYFWTDTLIHQSIVLTGLAGSSVRFSSSDMVFRNALMP
jgi:hypothetical protein